MVKVFTPFIFILILFSGITLISLHSLAEGPGAVPQSVQDLTEEGPPLLARNPFVDAPYGRMNKTIIRNEANPGIFIKENDDKSKRSNKAEDIYKAQKIKGILLSVDYPAALVGHRVVKIGDPIGGFIVTDITREGVSVSGGDRVIQIPFE